MRACQQQQQLLKKQREFILAFSKNKSTLEQINKPLLKPAIWLFLETQMFQEHLSRGPLSHFIAFKTRDFYCWLL